MLLELWKPPPEKLNTYFILGEIIFNVNKLAEDHPNIDTDMLRGLAELVRDNHADTEDTLRALCQIFQDTYSFDFSINQLNSRARTQLTAFVNGKSAADVIDAGFDVRASLNAHHALNLSNHPRRRHKHEGVAHKMVEKAKAKIGNHPIVYEDTEETKIMEVRVTA